MKVKCLMLVLAALLMPFPAQANDVPGHEYIAYITGTPSYEGSCWPGPPITPCSVEAGDDSGGLSAVAVLDTGAHGQVTNYSDGPPWYGRSSASKYIEHVIADTTTTARVRFTFSHTFTSDLFPNPNPVNASARIVVYITAACGPGATCREAHVFTVDSNGTKIFDLTLGSVDYPQRGKITVEIRAIADVTMTPTLEQRHTMQTPELPVKLCLGRVEGPCIGDEGWREVSPTVYSGRGYVRSSIEITVSEIDIYES